MSPASPAAAPRIVCVSRNRGKRGTERMTDIYLQTLLQAGYRTSLMLPPDAALTEELRQRDQGDLLFPLPTGWRGRLVLDPFFRARVRAHLTDADLIITHNALLESALRPIATCPIVAVNHLDKLKRMARCDAVIALNTAIRQRLVSDGGFAAEPQRVFLLPNGLSELPPEPANGGNGEIPTLGFLGALYAHKGCGDLMQAAELSAAPKLRLIFAGEGAMTETLQQADATSRHQVELWGHIDDLPRFFRACDLICLPSHQDICPLSLIESMAFGMAVISTSHSGAVDMIEDGVNGLLTPPQDPQALAERIDRLLQDAELRRRLGRNARRTAEERFAPQAFCRDLSATVEQILSLGRKDRRAA